MRIGLFFASKAIVFTECVIILLAITLVNSHSVLAAQVAVSVTQVGASFSTRGEVKRLSLTGNVTKYVNSLADSGTMTASASDDGSGVLSLALSQHGTHSENFDPTAVDRACTWSGPDGQPQATDLSLCAAPLVWFLPNLALQPGSPELQVADQGIVQFGGHQVRSLIVAQAALSRTLSKNKMPSTTMTLGLDPVTLLPSVLRYVLHPDSNPLATIEIEVTYGKYSAEQGIQVPHLIRRRLNGSLDMELTVQAVTIP